jgi:hypothetical protein
MLLPKDPEQMDVLLPLNFVVLLIRHC